MLTEHPRARVLFSHSSASVFCPCATSQTISLFSLCVWGGISEQHRSRQNEERWAALLHRQRAGRDRLLRQLSQEVRGIDAPVDESTTSDRRRILRAIMGEFSPADEQIKFPRDVHHEWYHRG